MPGDEVQSAIALNTLVQESRFVTIGLFVVVFAVKEEVLGYPKLLASKSLQQHQFDFSANPGEKLWKHDFGLLSDLLVDSPASPLAFRSSLLLGYGKSSLNSH